jgi:hypothetical protein
MMAKNATDATDDINSDHDIDTEHESSVSGFSRARITQKIGPRCHLTKFFENLKIY